MAKTKTKAVEPEIIEEVETETETEAEPTVEELKAQLAALKAEKAEVEKRVPKPMFTSRVARWNIDPNTTKDRFAYSHEVFLKEGYQFSDGTIIKKFKSHDEVMAALESSKDVGA